MDNLNQWIDDRQSFERARHPQKKKRRKLLKRPLALRGNTNKVQPNTLYQIVGRYLTGTPLPPAYPVAQLMAPDLLLPQNAQEHLENLAKELLGAYDSWLNGVVQSSGWPHIGKRWSPWLPKGW